MPCAANGCSSSVMEPTTDDETRVIAISFIMPLKVKCRPCFKRPLKRKKYACHFKAKTVELKLPNTNLHSNNNFKTHTNEYKTVKYLVSFFIHFANKQATLFFYPKGNASPTEKAIRIKYLHTEAST